MPYLLSGACCKQWKGGQRVTDTGEGNLIVFDTKCVVCSGFARFMAKHDRNAKFRFADAHSGTERALYLQHGLDPDLMETNIVVLDGRSYTKLASLTAAMRALGWPYKALTIFDILPKRLANWLYDRLAQNRYRLGRQSCPVPSRTLKDRLID